MTTTDAMDTVKPTLIAADKAYLAGKYDEAADRYAEASEKLAEANGDESPDNADVLFLYGRALFKIAMQRSDVLGGGAAPAGVDVAATLAAALPASGASASTNGANTGKSTATPSGAPGGNPNFSFSGDGADEDDADAGWEDDDNRDAADGEQGKDEPEDEFQNAWEVLDLARVSFQRQLSSEDAKYTDKEAIRKRIAETYDLLGEVSLENENFDQAVADLRQALSLKRELYPEEHSEVSGAYYMCALALEYSSDAGARREAAECVASAVASFEKRLAKPDSGLSERKRKEEVEVLGELKSKLAELRQAPATIDKAQLAEMFGLTPASNGAAGPSTGAAGADTATTAALREQVAKAMANSNDLSSLVRKKEKKRPAPAATATATATATASTSTEQSTEAASKKVKVDDVPDAGN